MFRRKRDDGEDSAIPPMMDEPPATERLMPAHNLFPRPTTQPLNPQTLSGGPTFTKPPVPTQSAPPPPPPRPQAQSMRNDRSGEAEAKKLIVGQGICLSGQITACERLIVEGTMECSLSECRNIEIAESGFFKGQAEVDYADIGGRFEGTLVARERLFVRSSGRIHGKIHYCQIEIEPGGEISGDVKVVPGNGRMPALENGEMENGRAYTNGEAD
jgi:cytoskeletal protein CcmA (bactofilin family)